MLNKVRLSYILQKITFPLRDTAQNRSQHRNHRHKPNVLCSTSVSIEIADTLTSSVPVPKISLKNFFYTI